MLIFIFHLDLRERKKKDFRIVPIYSICTQYANIKDNC